MSTINTGTAASDYISRNHAVSTTTYRGDSFSNAYTVIKNHFNHDTTTTFARTRMENPNKSLHKYYLDYRYNNRNGRTRRGFRGKGRFSTNHTNEERKAARTQFFSACHFTGTLLPADFSVHLAEYKGTFIYYISSKDIYSRDDRYTRSVYQGILPNTGAANVSTVDPTVTMDTSTAGKTSIKFGKGSVTVSIGTAQIPTEIGKIDFEVLDAPTPLKVYFNNTTDELGHPWFYLNKRERATTFLIETELRRLYRRFGHPAVIRLARLLKDADVMYLRSKPILHIINTYQGPLDILTHDAGTNFASAEFRAKVKIIGVTCKQVPTETHWSVGKIERYHAPLHRAWDILYAELASTMSNKAILQIAVKAVNNTVGPNSLVLTLLSPPLPLIREKDRWNGPYKIATIDGHNVTVDMVNGPTTFRSTSNPNAPQQQHASPIDTIVPLVKQPRKRGYLPGLRNKRKANVYIIKKEEANLKLAIKLRNNRISNLEVHSRIYIFKSRLVRERVIIALAPMLAQTNLKRTILAHLPTKLAPRYLEGTLLHWTTYYRHYYKELDMSTLTYDLCLLVINSNADDFGITMLTLNAQLDFNSYILIIDASNMDNYKATLNLKQKGQGGKIKLININTPNRALRYIPITLIDAKLMVFVDSSFTNNKDLSSQLGFILMLVNKSIDSDNTFTICGNIIHYSLTKCKRVTRSVLASKIYSIVNGFDIGIAIATTL
ncbi:hypothetical protein BU23DRAFT_582982 [Bimuria novae-zelandiae CBS 107.79]|uniref:Integrase catalytic domain-containing protein n=1 Tax=Bimuria novae-zelandiae CBS 107.79 TaxID=1447943 RepID=A0A6A5UVY4_9PLEO|nr:hypothetical protein BU23DRAFT_582982 [Bimuria novae-zelandiae CBS 107.79]